MNNSFYILRHGQTEYQENKKDLVYPWEESITLVSLSDSGIEQIKEISKEIKELEIDFIYASDFRRTKETATIVSEEVGLDKSNLFFNSRLRDINLGIYHGGLKKKFYDDFPNFLTDFDQRPEKGESLREACKRVTDYVLEIDQTHQGKNILVISHGEPLWLLENTIKNLNKKAFLNKDRAKANYIQTGELRRLN